MAVDFFAVLLHGLEKTYNFAGQIRTILRQFIATNSPNETIIT